MENKEQQKVYLVTELADTTQQQPASPAATTYEKPRFTHLRIGSGKARVFRRGMKATPPSVVPFLSGL